MLDCWQCAKKLLMIKDNIHVNWFERIAFCNILRKSGRGATSDMRSDGLVFSYKRSFYNNLAAYRKSHRADVRLSWIPNFEFVAVKANFHS